MAQIELHPDFKDFLRLLSSHRIEYEDQITKDLVLDSNRVIRTFSSFPQKAPYILITLRTAASV